MNVRFEPATFVVYRACGHLTAPWTESFFVRSQVLRGLVDPRPDRLRAADAAEARLARVDVADLGAC